MTEPERRKTIGLVLDNLFEEYWQKLWSGISGRARERGIDCVCFAGGIPVHPRSALYDLVSKKNVDGLIVGPVMYTMGEREINAFFNRFGDVPLVTVGFSHGDYPCVCADNAAGFRSVIEHLIDVHRVSRIGFIRGPENNSDAEERFAIYREVLDARGLGYDPDLVCPGRFQREDGEAAVSILFDGKKLRPDALVAANDLMAVYASRALAVRGLSVPGDVAVAGFDNSSCSRYAVPPLSTVEQPVSAIGEASLDAIVSMLSGDIVPSRLSLPSIPVFRRSCGCTIYSRFGRPLRSMPHLPAPYCTVDRNRSSGAGIVELSREKLALQIADIFPSRAGKETRHRWARTIVDDTIEEVRRCESLDSGSTNVDGGGRGPYMEKVEAIVLEGFNHDVGIGTWEEVLLVLFNFIEQRADKKNSMAVESLYAELSPFVAALGEFHGSGISFLSHTDGGILELFIMYLSGRHDRDGIRGNFDAFLPRLGVRSCLIALYEGESGFKDRASAFYSYGQTGGDCFSVGEKFDSRTLGLRPGARPRRPFSLRVVLPVCHSEEHFGYVVFEPADIECAVTEPISTQLGLSFRMVRLFEKIQRYATDLESQVMERTEALHREVLEKETATKQIETLYVALRKAGEEKANFFVNLAHETKTPLTIISNYLDEYVRGREGDETLAMIKRHFDKLLRDMVNYLDVEKIERGQMFYSHNQTADLSGILRESASSFAALARKKNIDLDARISMSMLLQADPYAVERIVDNLLDNAVRYTDTGGKIMIECRATAASIELSVRDTGIGIPEDQLANIFEPYHQVSHEKRNHQGIGMGLSIVKKICDSLDARITVESTPGHGSVFRVIFKRHFSDSGKTTGTEVIEPSRSSRGPRQVAERVIRFDPERALLLVVDDNRDMLAFLEGILSGEYNVMTAPSARDALAQLDPDRVPDVIVSDIMMDGMDGLEFLANVASHEEYRHIPFLFLSARSTTNDRIRGLSIGAVDYIAKPFHAEELRLRIESILRNRKLQSDRGLKTMKTRMQTTLDRMMLDDKPADRRAAIPVIGARFRLSDRELAVMTLLIDGISTREIATRLGISPKTVEAHIHKLYSKCGVHSRIEILILVDRTAEA